MGMEWWVECPQIWLREVMGGVSVDFVASRGWGGILGGVAADFVAPKGWGEVVSAGAVDFVELSEGRVEW
jgi:hypothetical protein